MSEGFPAQILLHVQVLVKARQDRGETGEDILIDAFGVVVIGGLGSVVGSIVGSLIVGASKTWGTYLFPEGAMLIIYILARLTVAHIKAYIIYLLQILKHFHS